MASFIFTVYFLNLIIMVTNCLNFTILGVFEFDCLPSGTRNATSQSDRNHFIEYVKKRLPTLDKISISYEEMNFCENSSSVWTNIDDIIKESMIIEIITDGRLLRANLLENMTSFVNIEKIPVFVHGYEDKDIENHKGFPVILTTDHGTDDVTTIVELTLKFKWTYVQMIYQDSFKNISRTYKNQLEHQNVCVLKEYVVKEDLTDSEYRLLLDHVTLENKTKGVIVFMDEIKLRKLLLARHKMKTGDMFFISLSSVLSDSVTSDTENSVLGTITVREKLEEKKYVEDYLNHTGSRDKQDGLNQFNTDYVLQSITKLLLSLTATLKTCGIHSNQRLPETDEECMRSQMFNSLKKKHITEVFNFQIANQTYSWIKIAEFDGTNISTYNEPIFYDKSGTVLTSVPESYSDPYRYECRPTFYSPVVSDSADLYIVAVLPVHETGNTPDGCGRLKSHFAIASESIIFGINNINREQSILSNLTLGYIILDSCGLKDRVMFQFDKLFAGNLNPHLDKVIPQRIIGTVGFPEDRLYMEIAPYLASRQLVTISNYATSATLSDKKKYPYFLRMSPSENTEVDVLFSVLENLKIKQTGLIYSNSDYGISRAKHILNIIDKNDNISVNYQVRFDDEYTTIDDVIDYLVSTFLVKNVPFVKTFIVFLETEQLDAILPRLNVFNTSELLLISSAKYISEIGPKTRLKIEETFKDAIFIEPFSRPVSEFQNHLELVSILGESKNNYFAEYLNCNGSDVRTCDQHLNTSVSGFSLTIDSVSALANGIKKLIASVCTSNELCYEAKQNLNKLPEHIQSQTFTGINGNKVQFDSKGDSNHVFEILLLKGHSFHQIGQWKNGLLKMKSSVSINENTPCISPRCFKPQKNLLDMKYIYEYGQMMVYGFLEIHSKTPSGECSDNIDEKGFQILNSIIWSVNEINKAAGLLPNTTLGVAVFDTCGLRERAEGLSKSVLMPSFILSQDNVISHENIVLGVIGGDTDITAISLEKGIRMMDRHIPLIVTSHTSALNDRNLHPRLYRTVLPDTVKIDFLLQFLVHFNWTYVHVIFDSFNHNTMDYLEQNGSELGICLATKSVLENPEDTVFLNSVFDNITAIPEASVVVLVTETRTIRKSLKTARDKGLSGKLHWVVPNEEGNTENIYKDLEDAAIGLITVKSKVEVNKLFMKEFSDLHLLSNKTLLWLPEYFQKTHQCNLKFSNKYDKSCRSDITMNSTNPTVQDFRTAASINAVYSLATAFDTVMKKCNGLLKDCTKRNRTYFYSELEKALDDVKAFPKGGNPFHFLNRNATTLFKILNLQRSPNGKVRFLEVGSFVNGKLQLDHRKMLLRRDRQQDVPLSHCSSHCLQCIDANFLSKYSDRVKLLYLEGPPMNHHFGSALGLITILLNFTCVVLVVVVLYYIYNNTRHKAISLVLDANIFLLFSSAIVTFSSIAFLFDTSEVTCLIQRAIPGCVLTVPIGCLLIKLNKAVCLRDIVGQKQIQVPKWDFCFTFIPVMMTSPVIVYIAWTVHDQSSVSWLVQDVHDVTKIEEIKISWTCNINRNGFLILFTITWQLLIEAIILTTNYSIRHSTQPEIKEVMRSLVVITTVVLVWSCVLFLTENFETFSVVVCVLLSFVGILLIPINFLQFILILINEEKQTMDFSTTVLSGKSKNLFLKWRENTSTGAQKLEQKKSSDTDIKKAEYSPNQSQSVSAKRAFTKWKRKDEMLQSTENL